MKLDAYKAMAAADAHIDQADLAGESMRIPQLHSKWLNHFTDEKLLLRTMTSEFKKLNRKKWEYYSGKLSEEEIEELDWEPFDKKILRADIPIYLEADEELTRLGDKIAYQKMKVEFLESVLKSINNRQWNIRGAIDWRKFTHGGP